MLRRRRHVHERALVLAALAAASVCCVGMELIREERYHSEYFSFLRWNLVLAWIPLLVALAVYHRYQRTTRLAPLVPLLGIWLLFLPNAPYIATDVIHLREDWGAPWWYDALTIAAFAATGLVLGFVSLYLVHAVLRHRLGARSAWACVALVLPLVSAGVYLGRVLRWNSWDLLTRPGQRLAQVSPHVLDPATIIRVGAVTLLVTLLLGLGYLSFYALIGTRLAPLDRRGQSRF